MNGGDGKKPRIIRPGEDKVIRPVRLTPLPPHCPGSSFAMVQGPDGDKFMVCKKCGVYTAHVAPASYAILFQGISNTMRLIFQDIGYEGSLTMQAFKKIEAQYKMHLTGVAAEILKAVIVKHLGLVGGDEADDKLEVEREDEGEPETDPESGGSTDDGEDGG